MKKGLPFIFTATSLIALCISVYFMFQIMEQSKKRQLMSQDLAVLSSIKYGMLNADLWKEKAVKMMHDKITEFSLDTATRHHIKNAIEFAMDRMITELENFLTKESNKKWQNKLKIFINEKALQPIDLRSRIPKMSKKVMAELEKEKVQSKLKSYLNKQVELLVAETDKTIDDSAREYIRDQYGYSSNKACINGLSSQIQVLQKKIWWLSIWAMIPALVAFLSFAFSNKKIYLHFLILVLMTITLLIGGVSIPMIDIDARISELFFKILGEEMRFEDQLLFYQSKSISDVVYLLVFKGDPQTMAVGILIMTFSIIFPVAKIIASIFAYWRIRLLNFWLIRFLVLKSGKWSMADVMVVAVFMAFIGFRGILKGQLKQLEDIETVDMITTYQFTSLQPGILLFSAFCLASLFLAVFMQAKYKKYKKQSATTS